MSPYFFYNGKQLGSTLLNLLSQAACQDKRRKQCLRRLISVVSVNLPLNVTLIKQTQNVLVRGRYRWVSQVLSNQCYVFFDIVVWVMKSNTKRLCTLRVHPQRVMSPNRFAASNRKFRLVTHLRVYYQRLRVYYQRLRVYYQR